MLGRFRTVGAIVAAVLLAGCGRSQETTAYADYVAWPADVADASCASEFRLRLTGFCTQDDPRLFVATTPDLQPPQYCKWRVADAGLLNGFALVFRVLTCREEMEVRNGSLVPMQRYRPIRIFGFDKTCGVTSSSPSEVVTLDVCLVAVYLPEPGRSGHVFRHADDKSVDHASYTIYSRHDAGQWQKSP